jgi:hypothetical protein
VREGEGQVLADELPDVGALDIEPANGRMQCIFHDP